MYDIFHQLNTITVKNSQARNSKPEHVNQVVMRMCRTAELNMRDTVPSEDVVDFLTDAPWRICFTNHTVLKASTGAVIFGQGILMNIPHVVNWMKIEKHMQHSI